MRFRHSSPSPKQHSLNAIFELFRVLLLLPVLWETWTQLTFKTNICSFESHRGEEGWSTSAISPSTPFLSRWIWDECYFDHPEHCGVDEEAMVFMSFWTTCHDHNEKEIRTRKSASDVNIIRLLGLRLILIHLIRLDFLPVGYFGCFWSAHSKTPTATTRINTTRYI